jgi:sugar (pentulose or hexulose) kinase
VKEVIVSGGILHSPRSLCLLADALGRDLRVSVVAEASIRGAAIYVLEKLGCAVQPLPRGRLVKHNRALAKKHRARRENQIKLEKCCAD